MDEMTDVISELFEMSGNNKSEGNIETKQFSIRSMPAKNIEFYLKS